MKECVASMAGPLAKASFARKARRCKISGRVEKNANPQLIRLNSGPATKGCLAVF